MIAGICRLDLAINGAFSLKDKRQVIRSVMERLKSRFNLSVAETALNDIWNRAEIGITVVSNDAAHIDSMLSSITAFIDNDSRVEIIDSFTEKLYYE